MRKDPFTRVRCFHGGVDIVARRGSSVVATSAGTVVEARWKGKYGLQVVLDHGSDVKTRFAHMSRLRAKKGQSVQKGDRLGSVGSTGRSTGPHLHYEVIVRGVLKNPLRYVPRRPSRRRASR